jgi:ribosomal protein S18 acetylase RimI-like enzyme
LRQPLFHKAEEHFFSLLSAAKFTTQNIAAFTTGVPSSGLNPAFIRSFNQGLIRDLQSCQDFYRKADVPWALVLPEYINEPALEHLLIESGFQVVDTGVAMSFDLSHLQNFSRHSLHIEAVEDLQAWRIPIEKAFESNPASMNKYTNRHQLALQNSNNMQHFVGFLGEQPVSALSTSIVDNVARIDDVATCPEFQNKGNASELIAHTLQYIKDLGIDTCFLEASEQGLQVYLRAGFQRLFKNYYYELCSNIG